MIGQLAQAARGMSYPDLALGPALLLILVLGPLAWRLATVVHGSRPAALVAAVCLSAAVTVTLARPGLGRVSGDWSRLASNCVVTDPQSTSNEALLNWLLLVPFAAAAVLAFGRPLLVILFAVAVSAGIETVQAVYSVGACDSSDLLRNSAGALVAALLAVVVRVGAGPDRHERIEPPTPSPSVARVGSPRW